MGGGNGLGEGLNERGKWLGGGIEMGVGMACIGEN